MTNVNFKQLLGGGVGCQMDVWLSSTLFALCAAHHNDTEIWAHARLSGTDWIHRCCQQVTSQAGAQTALLTVWRWTEWQQSIRVTAWVTLLCKWFPPSPSSYFVSILNTSNYTELPAEHLTNPPLSSQDRFWLIRIKHQKRPLYNGQIICSKGYSYTLNWWGGNKHAQTCKRWRSCSMSNLAWVDGTLFGFAHSLRFQIQLPWTALCQHH